MDIQEEKAVARGRYKNVVKASELPEREFARDMDKFGAGSREAAVSVGAVDLGYCVVSLDPGKRSCPLHFHHTEEEMFFVLKGQGMLRQGKEEDGDYEEIEVHAGEFVAFPAGTQIAHQFLNHTDEPFEYMAVSTTKKSDVCEYPDSDKLLVRRTGLILRREPALGYFDGEL
jgi:uncharacterized cupin superfamily protein